MKIMKYIKKTMVYSLLAATVLTATPASAAPIVYTNFNQGYRTYGRGYVISYGNNRGNRNNNNTPVEQEPVIDQYPVWTWKVVTTRPSTRPGTVVELPSKPETPKTEEPTKPVEEKPTTPTKPAEPAPTTPSTPGLSAVEAEVVRLVNIERQKEGLKPLVASAQLSNVARKKSEDMARNNYFSHTSPTYGSPFDMMRSFGISYRTAGENIARGQLTAQSVVNGWMNSPGHRANIMNPSFGTIGVGHYKSSNGTNYWTQMFTD